MHRTAAATASAEEDRVWREKERSGPDLFLLLSLFVCFSVFSSFSLSSSPSPSSVGKLGLSV